jgi:hypothetical protein
MTTTTHAAPEAVSLATFKTWLKARQQSTTEAMSVTTGDAFGKHLALLLVLIEARRAVDLFELEGGAA